MSKKTEIVQVKEASMEKVAEAKEGVCESEQHAKSPQMM